MVAWVVGGRDGRWYGKGMSKKLGGREDFDGAA